MVQSLNSSDIGTNSNCRTSPALTRSVHTRRTTGNGCVIWSSPTRRRQMTALQSDTGGKFSEFLAKVGKPAGNPPAFGWNCRNIGSRCSRYFRDAAGAS